VQTTYLDQSCYLIHDLTMIATWLRIKLRPFDLKSDALPLTLCCLGGAVVGHWTRDQNVAGSTPSCGTIKSTRSTQPYIPLG